MNHYVHFVEGRAQVCRAPFPVHRVERVLQRELKKMYQRQLSTSYRAVIYEITYETCARRQARSVLYEFCVKDAYLMLAFTTLQRADFLSFFSLSPSFSFYLSLFLHEGHRPSGTSRFVLFE